MKVGVLALQGDFYEHEQALRKLGVETVRVKLPLDLKDIDRLIIPGGESTTIGKLLIRYNLLDSVKKRVLKGMPVWGTCAGAILLAKHIAEGRVEGQPSLGLMDITAIRNAFGRQLDSFETTLLIKKVSDNSIPVIFIRAPALKLPGKGVEILSKLPDGTIVAAQQANMLATCFHPELTDNLAFHKYFLKL